MGWLLFLLQVGRFLPAQGENGWPSRLNPSAKQISSALDEYGEYTILYVMAALPKHLVWIGSSLKDLRSFPDDVKDVFGFALHMAQMGEKHADAKPLKGFEGSGVLEVVDDHDGDTYRAVYTVRFEGFVYALHAFQKKSKAGIATPKADMDLVKSRLRLAQEDHGERSGRKKDG